MKVYVLYGSEDGLMGVYRLKNDAVAAARKYCGKYANVDRSKYVTFVSGDNATADIYLEDVQ